MDSTFTLGSEYANIRQTIETAIPGKRWSACKITNVLVVWGSKRERLMEILRIRRDTHVQHCVARFATPATAFSTRQPINAAHGTSQPGVESPERKMQGILRAGDPVDTAKSVRPCLRFDRRSF
jgi:hypothetical protein